MDLQSGRGGRSALERAQRENETLYAVIKTVSSSLDLDRVLRGIVDIATDATGCHACFIYFLEGDRLVLRAASPRYCALRRRARRSGSTRASPAGSRATKTPEFIPENAMADPRMKYVPELEEERFQSMVAVPILAKAGDVIGVVVLHTAAPARVRRRRAQLPRPHRVAGRRRDRERAALRGDAPAGSGADDADPAEPGARRGHPARGPLRRRSPAGARELLRADACQIYRLDADADELVLAASDPDGAPAPSHEPGGTGLVLDLMRRANGRRPRAPPRGARRCGRTSTRTPCCIAPLVARDEQLGVICCLARDREFSRRGRGAARRRRQPDRGRAEEGRADRAADRREHRQGHVRRARRGLGRGRGGEGERGGLRPRPAPPLPARRARRRHGRRAAPVWPELASRFEARLRRAVPAGVLRLPPRPAAGAGAARRRARWRRSSAVRDAPASRWRREEGLVVGLSEVDRGAASARRRMREAADAARIGRSLVGRGGRGLLRAARRLPLPGPPRARRGAARPLPAAVEELLEYDRRRGVAAGRHPGAVPRATAAASPPAPGRSTSIRTPCASGSSGSSASPISICPARTCCRWSSR